MRHHGWFVGLALPLVCLCADTRSQEPPLFYSRSDLVVLHVTVRDKGGAYVAGLSRDTFRVLEDGRPQPITFFTSEDRPVTFGLLIDGSGSMQANRDLVVTAAASFAAASNPDDEMCALLFNEHVYPVLPPGAPFTSDVGVLREALARTISARGRTALYDAVSAGLDHLDRGRYEWKILVLLGDGADNASQTTFMDVIAKIERSNTAIHSIALVDPVDRDAKPKRLEQMSRASGGEAFTPRDVRHVTDALRQIALDIRRTYTIGYVPMNAARDGALRRLQVVVDAPDRRSVVVRSRAGYVATPGPAR